MSAAIDVTAVLSFDTQIFLCKIKLSYKQYPVYSIFIKTNIYYNELKTTQHGFNIFNNNCLLFFLCTCSTFNIKNMCKEVMFRIYGNLVYPEIFSRTNVSG